MITRLNQRLQQVQKNTWERQRVIAGFLRVIAKSNKSLFIIYVIIAVFCSAVFFTSSHFKGLADILSASALTPWGIATSVFVHGGGISHLTGNLLGLLVWFTIFAATNNNLEYSNKRISTRFFVAIIFLAGFVSNLLWIIIMPQSYTSGLSGVVYASEGVILTLSLSNTLTLPKMSR